MGILDDNFLGDIFADSGASGNVSMEKGKVFLGGEWGIFGFKGLDIVVEVVGEGFVFVDGDGGS